MPAVGDLDVHGAPDVVFVRPRSGEGGRSSEAHEKSYELVAVDGRNGRIKWTWPWLNADEDIRPPLLVDFEGMGRHSICLFIHEASKSDHGTVYQPAAVILDGAGKPRRRVDFASSGPLLYYWDPNWWRKADLNSDGKESLLLKDGHGTFQAVGGEQLEPLWKWNVPGDGAAMDEFAKALLRAGRPVHLSSESSALLELVPGGKSVPATIAVWAGKSVYGVSGATGRPRWRGEMPAPPPYGQLERPEHLVLADSNGLGRPRVLAGDGCRLTWPVDEQGRYQPPSGTPMSYTATLDSPPSRPLPWAPGGYDIFGIAVIVRMVPCSFLWLVVPVLLTHWAMKRNSWRLAFVPALYQLAMTLSLQVIPMSWLPFNAPISVSTASGDVAFTPELPNWDPHVGMCVLSGVFLIVHYAWMIHRRLWPLVGTVAILLIAIAIGWSQRVPVLEHSEYVSDLRTLIAPSLGETLRHVGGSLALISVILFVALYCVRQRQWILVGVFLLLITLAAAFAVLQQSQAPNWRSPAPAWLVETLRLVAGSLPLIGAILFVAIYWLRRRQWIRLGVFLLASITVAAAFAELQQSQAPILRSSAPAWIGETLSMLAVLGGGLPFIVAIALTAILLRRRQWNRLGPFLLVSLVLAATFAKFQLQQDVPRMATDEQYTLDGWYLILLYGVYLASCLVLLGWLGKLAFRSARQGAAWIHSRLSRNAVA